jgi:hypothetical protein
MRNRQQPRGKRYRPLPLRQGDLGQPSVDCYPGGCPFHVFVRDGKIVREQSGTLPVISRACRT